MTLEINKEYRSYTLSNIRELLKASCIYSINEKELIFKFFKENEKKIMEIVNASSSFK